MSVIEIGFMTKGHKGLNYNAALGLGWMYDADTAGGVGVRHEYYNAGDKVIKYLTFTYVAYNAVNDMISCTVSGEQAVRVRITGPIQPHSVYTATSDILWYNPTVQAIKVQSLEIQYADDTVETVAGEALVPMSSKESVYYEKIGRAEEEERAKRTEAAEQKKAAQEQQERRQNYAACYWFFVVLGRLQDAKTDEVMRFHANQGLWLLILEALSLVLLFVPYAGGFLFLALLAFCVTFSVIGSINAQKGIQKELPLLGKLPLLK